MGTSDPDEPMANTTPPLWRQHLPLTISAIVVLNFVVRLLFVSQGSFEISVAMIASDPTRVALVSLLLSFPSVITFSVIYFASEAVGQAVLPSRRLLASAAVVVFAYLSLRFQAEAIAFIVLAQSAVYIVIALYSRGALNLLVMPSQRKYSDARALLVASRRSRRKTSIIKAWTRIYNRFWFICTAVTIRGESNVRRFVDFLRLRGRRSQEIAGSQPVVSASGPLRFVYRQATLESRRRIVRIIERTQYLVKDQGELLALAIARHGTASDLEEIQPWWPNAGKSGAAVRYIYEGRAVTLVANTVLAVALTLSTPFFPLERISIQGRGLTGYVVSSDVTTTTVLERSPRRIVYLRTNSVTSRVQCVAVRHASSRLLLPLLGPFPKFPRC